MCTYIYMYELVCTYMYLMYFMYLYVLVCTYVYIYVLVYTPYNPNPKQETLKEAQSAANDVKACVRRQAEFFQKLRNFPSLNIYRAYVGNTRKSCHKSISCHKSFSLASDHRQNF